ncbi:PLP-dependent aminotransferase family protein [Chryseobacterium indologenes]|uniref:aminotransferase-like domain-containing protein n=1 Tax=Chryseobacterium indologenes TaxID=253 RepID=UPI0023E81C7D|nr:PLP-dependent aminotransferase family protein [Chryseobacterium indologenes]WET49156.1 PLP-dependent aminotransferase family protein [Chryseobacterium indologenes]
MKTLNKTLGNLENDAMGFLNEIQLNFPKALSLASGRPDETFFDLDKMNHYFEVYTNYVLAETNIAKEDLIRNLGQYNKSKGIINDIVAAYLKKQYKIQTAPENILLTVGTQESIILTLLGLINNDTDVIAVEDPAYIGLSDYAKIAGHSVQPIKMSQDNTGLCLNNLEEKVQEYQQIGKKIKIVYVIPDFQNPSGNSMSLEKRKSLLEMAEKYDFYIIEDNAYGDFMIEGEKYPTLKSIDDKKRVIYFHSLSKIIHPSLRMGILVADQIVENQIKLSDILAKIKGYTTVNTPSIPQCVFAGILIENQFDLEKYNEQKVKAIVAKRDELLRCLDKYFKHEKWSKDISWNIPKGGFFLSLKVPVEISREHVYECAENYGVIFTPMSFFYLGKGGENEIRLAYSYVAVEKIDTAINNLSKYLNKII